MTETVLAEHHLDNGLELLFRDHGNRYFGDYHQVKITVSCRIPLVASLVCDGLSAEDLHKAQQLFGDHVEYKRLIKQMGVAGADVETVKQGMISNFIDNAAAYMQGEDFAARIVARKLVEHKNRSRLHLVGYD